jgi:hypothetical protein
MNLEFMFFNEGECTRVPARAQQEFLAAGLWTGWLKSVFDRRQPQAVEKKCAESADCES